MKASVESLISVYVEVAVLAEELRWNSCTALFPEQHREKGRSYQGPPAYQYHPRHRWKPVFFFSVNDFGFSIHNKITILNVVNSLDKL